MLSSFGQSSALPENEYVPLSLLFVLIFFLNLFDRLER
jgi:hypothetical protein